MFTKKLKNWFSFWDKKVMTISLVMLFFIFLIIPNETQATMAQTIYGPHSVYTPEANRARVIIFNNLTDNISTETTQVPALKPYQAQFYRGTGTEVNLEAGKSMTYEVKFKNTGAESWSNNKNGLTALKIWPLDLKSDLYHKYWKSKQEPARMVEKKVDANQVGTFRFAVQAPAEPGCYTEKFKMMIGEAFWVEGAEIQIEFNVWKGKYEDHCQPIYSNPIPLKPNATATASSDSTTTTPTNSTPVYNFTSAGPNLRVGLYATTGSISITANGIFEVRTEAGELIHSASAGEIVKSSFNFEAQKYLTQFNNKTNISARPIKFVPLTKTTIMEITNLNQIASWNEDINYNRYRGTLEVNYNDTKKNFWLINELPLEDYLKGLKESSNISPLNFQKSLIIAARTYALYHFNNPTKHGAENFVIDDYYDQVYKGYQAEQILPKVSQAVEETNGVVITYNNEVVITPYFSQSDGRTRAWEEVWAGGPKTWLISKDDPYNKGLELWGHGVGMSARGAINFANYGFNYEEILKYYYSGVQLAKIY